MSGRLAPVVLAVRPGTGRLCRRPHGLLFTPTVDESTASLHDAFSRASDAAAAVDAVTAVVVDRGMQVPPFACVTWHDRVGVLVYGDVQVRTDHPAMPMLSGAASETWVEHAVRGGPDTVTVDVEPPDATDTDLEAGTVPAAGFRLVIPVTPAPGGPPERGEAAPPPEQAPAPSPPPPAPARPPTLIPPPTVAAPPADAPAPTGTDQGEGSLAAIQAAAVVEGEAPAPPAPAAPAPEPAEPAPELEPDGAASTDTGALVEAVVCDAGHANRPGTASCRVCGGLLVADAAVQTMPRPSMGRLAVDGGEVIGLDTDVVLGRRPTAPAGTATLVVPGEKVSRSHAEVTVRGWDVYVRDLGSTNGTHVIARTGDEPMTLAEDVPTRILPGAVVYVGSTAVQFLPPEP